MKRPDDFATRRRDLAGLTEEALQERFWQLAGKIVAPLIELARTHTTPALERSVLLRMGLDSLEAGSLVEETARRGQLGFGAGNVLLRVAADQGLGLHQAARQLQAGRFWDRSRTLATEGGGPPVLGDPAPPGGGIAAPAGPPLRADGKLDLEAILCDLEHYRPRRRGWTWRRRMAAPTPLGPFLYRQTGEPLARSVPLPAARYFDGIDPQPDLVITAEIASGRFEDDLRRMRMAAWHGADHIMVIRTAGQSHIDGLLEGTPEGVGGVPITRKQLRATRKALDFIEDEVGRPINLHSYVSGVAGPEMAVLFAEEGVNGAHQDPQYNILYRNVNMVRSFVDAAEAKAVMLRGGMVQIDGAHNANATALQAWKVMPELLVQHAINSAYSLGAGLPRGSICLSTVPPSAPPAPALALDLPYAVALRQVFAGFGLRAQMNTRYIESDEREATVTHVLNLLITRLTGAHIQSTITPDEGRNVPWHHNSVAALETAKQALVGMDGLAGFVNLRLDGELGLRVREIKERAVLFLQEILEVGGYFAAVEKGFFVDSGQYPERHGDGIVRKVSGGVGEGTVVPREAGYFAPVCGHFGVNHPRAGCHLIGGCTFCRPDRIVYVDELDAEDNVRARLEGVNQRRQRGLIRPEVQWAGDGFVTVTMTLPEPERRARYAALKIGAKMGLEEVEVIHRRVLHPDEGTVVVLKGRLDWDLLADELEVPEEEAALSDEALREAIARRPMRVVAATLGEDEHSVGMREILDIKHGGLEKYGIEAHYLGTSVPPDKLIDAARELDAEAILASTIITHADVHRKNLTRLAELCREKGVRDRFILLGGGTQITDELARQCGLDGGFGRGTRGRDVASFLVRRREDRQE
ncbi:MAG: D-ornithine 4,5-aminomutase subunit OraE [bacterium]|nr:D-ornithine 4,5-aminomutase subunit OraE [bacterium]